MNVIVSLVEQTSEAKEVVAGMADQCLELLQTKRVQGSI